MYIYLEGTHIFIKKNWATAACCLTYPQYFGFTIKSMVPVLLYFQITQDRILRNFILTIGIFENSTTLFFSGNLLANEK